LGEGLIAPTVIKQLVTKCYTGPWICRPHVNAVINLRAV
jgi:hypothetical protein